MPTVTVSSEGHVVISAEVLDKLRPLPGSEVEVTAVGDRVEIARKGPEKPSSHEAGVGMLRYRGAPHRLADFDVAEAMAAGTDRGRG